MTQEELIKASSVPYTIVRATQFFFASRFLLRKGRPYQAAVEAFSPYSEVKDVNPEVRDAIKALAQRSSKRPSFIFVNNRLEGNALKTISEALVNGVELFF